MDLITFKYLQKCGITPPEHTNSFDAPSESLNATDQLHQTTKAIPPATAAAMVEFV